LLFLSFLPLRQSNSDPYILLAEGVQACVFYFSAADEEALGLFMLLFLRAGDKSGAFFSSSLPRRNR